MTLEQAKLELDACTLRPQDATAAARAIAENDAALSEWLQKRLSFDEQMAATLSVPAIPAGLRDQILRDAQKPKTKASRWLAPVALSAAAALLLGWTLFWPDAGQMPSWQADSIAAVAKLQYKLSRLDERAPTLEEVKLLLAATNSTSPQQQLPAALASLPTYGCKRIQVGHLPATIICFKMASGHEAHLVVVDAADLEAKETQFSTRKNWNMATWSEGRQTYMLATTSDTAELKNLLGLS